jgi:dGTPase
MTGSRTPPLAHLRFPVAASRGRRYPEPPHPYRNEFQRDRDRIVHARAFRRLENKTQVFTSPISDHFRNRLTHSLEVSQIARTVASVLGLDEDLTEALALAHDFGHPPFAHAGESELDRQMRRRGDRFDHNLHALRIVESFEQRYARFPGLNLTFEVREGMAKHSRDIQPGEFPELDDYLPGLRPPVEAQLIDLADEVAYNTADLDDGFEARLLDLETILAGVPIFAEAYREVERRAPHGRAKLKFNEALKRVLDRLATDLIEHTRSQVEASGVRDVEEVRRYPRRLVSFSPDATRRNAELKQFLYAKLYEHPALVEERERSVEALEQLFRSYVKNPEAMPKFYAEQARTVPCHRVVCDYIAGMTDHYLLRQQRGKAGART